MAQLSYVVADRVATGNITLNGSQGVDGGAVPNGQTVLATAQTNAAENGLWIVNTAGAWTRSPDDPVPIGSLVYVRTGAAFMRSTWRTWASATWEPVCLDEPDDVSIGHDAGSRLLEIKDGGVNNNHLFGQIDLTTKVVNRLPFANAPQTTRVDATGPASNLTLPADTWTTVVFGTENTDGNGEYNPADGTFAPLVTGDYIVSTQHVLFADAARCLCALWVGATSIVSRFSDGPGFSPGGSYVFPLTSGVGYRIRLQHIGVGGTAYANASFLRIRRLG